LLDKILSRRQDRQFEAACIEHMDALYACALRFTHNRHDSEELVQDTYVKALRSSHQFEWGTNLRAWLIRILTNTFMNKYRRRVHERRYQERAVDEPIYDELLDREAKAFASNPENHIFTQFFKEKLEGALQELPPDFRAAVVLSDIEELSYKEIAEILGCPIGTVMSRLYRGRRLLQQRLVDYAVAAGIENTTKQATAEPADLDAFRQRKKVSS
jgi:RNA polymerase sigma-70 factor (ECF subfamily)